MCLSVCDSRKSWQYKDRGLKYWQQLKVYQKYNAKYGQNSVHKSIFGLRRGSSLWKVVLKSELSKLDQDKPSMKIFSLANKIFFFFLIISLG